MPSFFSTVTVKVCAVSTLFVPDGAIEMRASTTVSGSLVQTLFNPPAGTGLFASPL